MNFERPKLPAEILKHSLVGKRKYFSYICLEVEKSDAEVRIFLHETGSGCLQSKASEFCCYS